MAKNKNLIEAKKNKNDEFYTNEETVEEEIIHYLQQIEGKVIYCNCSTEKSYYWIHLRNNFHKYKLKGLIATGLGGIRLDYDGITEKKSKLQGNGEFESQECLNILNNEADIVFENPPFSLWREYVDLMIKSGKSFLILGREANITYKEVFKKFQNGKIWIGYTIDKPRKFYTPSGEEKKINICYFTNLYVSPRKPLILCKEYYGNEKDYPKYDNYDAIECSKVVNIPKDYYGYIGVPITYLGCHCSDQFEIVGLDRYISENKYPNKRMFINGNELYTRIIIKRK